MIQFRQVSKLVLISTLFGSGVTFADPATTTSAGLSDSKSRWSNSKLSLAVGMALRQIEDEFTDANLVRVDLGLEASTDFTPWLSGKLGIKFVSLAGSTVSVFDEYKPKTSYGFEETFVDFKPLEEVSLKVGFIGITESELADIMQAKEHPGSKFELRSGPKERAHVRLSAFAVIPTSTLVTPRYFPADGNPSLQGFSLAAGIDPERGLGLKVAGSRYRFASLTPSIAEDSRLMGNEVLGLGGASARFRNQFETDEINLIGKYKFSRTEVSLEGTSAFNQKVASELGTGTHAGVSFKRYFRDFAFKLSYSEFYVNPEVYPGSIAGDLFSYNNRQGRQISLTAEDPKETLGLRLTYHTYNEIVDQPFLADRQYLGIRFFSKNDILGGAL